MSLDVTSVGALGAALAPPPQPAPVRPAPAARVTPPPVVVDTLPDRPPPEVLEAMEAAARALERMRQLGRALRFSRDEESGELTIEVRTLDGELLATIPPDKLLDLITEGTAP